MATKSVFQQLMRRFWRDRRGNYAMMMGILAPTLVLAAGYGLNVAQLSTARSNLLAALDSAVTSTARDISIGIIKEDDAEKMIEVFLLANGERAFSEGDRVKLEKVTVDRFRKTVIAEASVVVDAVFPLFGAANHNKITTQSAAMYSDRNIEVAMMLDVTLSMQEKPEKKDKKGNITQAGTNKIGDLRDAATIAVEELLAGNKHSSGRVRVAIVPYADSVNVGEALAKSAVFQETASGQNVPPSGWKAPAKPKDYCATERKLSNGAADKSDDGPDFEREAGKGNNKYKYKARVNRYYNLKASECPSAKLIPLTTDEETLKTEIAGFEAAGFTGGGIATQWTYYMLSPKWRRTISDAELGAGPADRNPDKIAKIAILMTDGAYNTAFAGDSATNANDICTQMKKDGIEVFTIGFDLPTNNNAPARKTLRDCASPDTALTKHFYDAATGDELKQAFRDIVRNIERLALIR